MLGTFLLLHSEIVYLVNCKPNRVIKRFFSFIPLSTNSLKDPVHSMVPWQKKITDFVNS